MSSDRRDEEYGYPAQELGIQFADATNITSLEILRYEAVRKDGGVVIDEKKEEVELRSGEVGKWISKDPESEILVTDIKDGENISARFVGGLRVLLGACSYNTDTLHRAIPLQKVDFDAVESRMSLPEPFISGLSIRTAFAASFSCSSEANLTAERAGFVSFQPTSCHIIKYSIFRPSAVHVAISRSPSTNIVYALILSKTHDPSFSNIIKQALTSPSKSHDVLRPLTIPLMIAGLCHKASDNRVQGADTQLNGLEETLGQHEWINRPMGDPLSIDFLQTGRRLNFIARVLGVETTRVLGLLETLKEIKRIDAEIGEQGGDCRVIEMVRYWENLSRMLALRVQYEEKRVESQLAVVYQFMTQKDAKVNIELAATSATIARATKKDGSAMKTIAILTMFFLPGTFLAALFAMPLFNWDEEKGPVMKSRFKYYWAIAIPMTVLVLAIWAFAIFAPWKSWLSKWKRRSKNVDLEISGKEE